MVSIRFAQDPTRELQCSVNRTRMIDCQEYATGRNYSFRDRNFEKCSSHDSCKTEFPVGPISATFEVEIGHVNKLDLMSITFHTIRKVTFLQCI